MKTDRENPKTIMTVQILKTIAKRGFYADLIADDLISKGVTIPVRCGKCKWGHSYERYDGTEGTECGKYGTCRMADDFCSRGERKEE